jgi:PAS domain-containing protein
LEKHIGSDALSCDLQPDISLQDSLAGLAGESAGLWACDAYSGQMYLSVRARELLCIGASEHATLPRMAAATHPDDRAVLEHWLLGRDHAHSVFTIDIRLAGADAGDRKLRIDGRVHRDGISLRSGGSIVDVTERRREE